MRIFEKCTHRTEIAQSINDTIGTDQFAYKEGHNSHSGLNQVSTHVIEMVGEWCQICKSFLV